LTNPWKINLVGRRLYGNSRAAAFFYAVAVGVVANVVIAHLTPHDAVSPTVPTSWPTIAKPETPVATAVIAPKPAEAKPAEPAHPIEASAPANLLPVAPHPAVGIAPTNPAPNPVPAPAMNAAMLPAVPTQTLNPPSPSQPAHPAQDASATLPSAATMGSPTLRPTALPTPPSAPVAADAKPDPPASNVEASASPATPAAAPISLLPTDPDQPAADQPPPKPAKPGPGSGGLY
jgi:translation initiation factor IF-2